MTEPRVCFVVTEILGLVRNGGIATATTHAALVLAEHDFDVDIFYCGHVDAMEEHWASRYVRAGISVHWLDRSQMAHPPYIADSYRLYHQIRDRGYDAIVFQDWQGLGYCSFVAKRAGLAFADTTLVDIAHGPGDWLRQANRQLAFEATDLAYAHLERRSAELADVMVSPSQHLLDWMLEAGWDVVPDRRVIPSFTEGHTVDLDASIGGADETASELTELVFFGRLEERKGVRAFTGALNAIGPELLRGMRVTFLGRQATMTVDEVTALLSADVRNSLGALTFLGSYDQAEARSYLRQPGRLAVMPSYLDNSPLVVYECIEDRVSFVASRAGGTGELVAEADRADTLFDPDPASLAQTLTPLLRARRKPPPPHPAFDGRASLDAWRSVLVAPAATEEPVASPDDAAPVTVVVPHFNQPVLIWPTLEAIAAQDHPNLEIVLVDDGSTDPDAVANLAALDAHDWGRPFRIVRQENQYLGAARNAGVRAAAHDLIAFVDDDDVVLPTYVSALVRARERFDADAVSIAIHAMETDAAGEFVEGGDNGVWAFTGDAVELGTVINVLGGAAALYRRQAIDAVGGFLVHRGIGHEDWDILARLNLTGHRVVSLPEPLYRYRVRAASMLRTTSTWANMQPLFESFHQHLPPALHVWAELLRGQQETIDALRDRLGAAEGERAQLAELVDLQQRYLSVLRRALPPKARAGIRSLLRL